MPVQNINPFCIIGIAIQTSNENGQSAIDIPLLWHKFMAEGIAQKIPGKIGNTLYCVYTSYQKDHTTPYTTILGCKVQDISIVPEGMTGIRIEGGAYIIHTAKGNLQQGIVFEEWVKIWNSPINRSYTADFEVYGPKAQDATNAEVDIFIAVK